MCVCVCVSVCVCVCVCVQVCVCSLYYQLQPIKMQQNHQLMKLACSFNISYSVQLVRVFRYMSLHLGYILQVKLDSKPYSRLCFMERY